MGTARDEYERTDEKHAAAKIKRCFYPPDRADDGESHSDAPQNHIRTPETPEMRSKVTERRALCGMGRAHDNRKRETSNGNDKQCFFPKPRR